LIDEKDRIIIDTLRKNARITLSELAKLVGISDVAVKKRIKKLEASGVIRGYRALIDPFKLGYVIAILGIDAEPNLLLDVAKTLSEREYTKYLAITTGDHMMMAVVWAKSREELKNIIEEVSRMKGVKKASPSIVSEILKF